ncbi:MAG: HutD family protein [Clostridiaceae bacterium]
MIARILKSDSFKRSEWSGGATTEFFIYPEGADFKDRTFDFRISSASFTSTESRFSDFTGYKRFILPLKGTLKLKHDEHHEAFLEPYQVDIFDGSWSTYSWNSLDCIDFNFIVSDKHKSDLHIFDKDIKYKPGSGSIVCVYSEVDFDITIESEKSGIEVIKVNCGDLLVIEEVMDEALSFKNLGKQIILCEFSKSM